MSLRGQHVEIRRGDAKHQGLLGGLIVRLGARHALVGLLLQLEGAPVEDRLREVHGPAVAVYRLLRSAADHLVAARDDRTGIALVVSAGFVRSQSQIRQQTTAALRLDLGGCEIGGLGLADRRIVLQRALINLEQPLLRRLRGGGARERSRDGDGQQP